MAHAPFSEDWLRRRFAARRAAPPSHPPSGTEAASIPAAVLAPIIARESGLTVLLTQRTAHLRDHAGQVSFPGGRVEGCDASPIDTALRESREEVGIEPAQVEILGALPEHITSTGFRITPVVGLVHPPLDLKLDDFEVAEVFEAPLAFFLDAANYRRESVIQAGRTHHFWVVPWQGYYIWGATASILVALRETLLHGR